MLNLTGSGHAPKDKLAAFDFDDRKLCGSSRKSIGDSDSDADCEAIPTGEKCSDSHTGPADSENYDVHVVSRSRASGGGTSKTLRDKINVTTANISANTSNTSELEKSTRQSLKRPSRQVISSAFSSTATTIIDSGRASENVRSAKASTSSLVNASDHEKRHTRSKNQTIVLEGGRSAEKNAKNDHEDDDSDEADDEPEESYEIEKILDHKRLSSGVYRFYIKWKGYPYSESTWENESHLDNCINLLQDYAAKNKLTVRILQKLASPKDDEKFKEGLDDGGSPARTSNYQDAADLEPPRNGGKKRIHSIDSHSDLSHDATASTAQKKRAKTEKSLQLKDANGEASRVHGKKTTAAKKVHSRTNLSSTTKKEKKNSNAIKSKNSDINEEDISPQDYAETGNLSDECAKYNAGRNATSSKRASHGRRNLEARGATNDSDEDNQTEVKSTDQSSNEGELDEEESYFELDLSLNNWTHLVKEIINLARSDDGEGVAATLLLHNGRKARYSTAVLSEKCPKMLIQFYESRITFH